ncbi:DUF7674 family protein [Kitasatospora sp. NPDC054939]
MSFPTWFEDIRAVNPALTVDEDLPLVFALADFGQSLANNASNVTDAQMGEIFGRMEEILESGSEDESTAVATGFLEALMNAWDQGFDLERSWRHVGPQARAYCLAWNAYSGISSPRWMVVN